jgi:EAL domain-containing protein (putative c-di-GMP-specific phosphodiesterase class I)
MIIEIGNIILYQSCIQAKKWQEKGYPPVLLAVNISPSQFKQQKLIHNIAEVLEQTGFDPQFLELEITESGIMENEKYNIKKLDELHKLGVKISIDDFGTGYSSLSKLKDYPIDTLKIDKSFIENCTVNEKSSTITRTIIDLAHNLGFKVVAEGVETKEQYDFIFNHKCDAFQGYYYSKPLTAEEFEEKLKNFNKKGD